jgi:hypothetical protein
MRDQGEEKVAQMERFKQMTDYLARRGLPAGDDREEALVEEARLAGITIATREVPEEPVDVEEDEGGVRRRRRDARATRSPVRRTVHHGGGPRGRSDEGSASV